MSLPRGRGPWRAGAPDPRWVMRVVGEASGTVYQRDTFSRWFDCSAPDSPNWTTWETLVVEEREVRVASAFFEPDPDPDVEPGALRCAVCHDPWPLGTRHECLPPSVPPSFRLGTHNGVSLAVDGCEWRVAVAFRPGFGRAVVDALDAWLVSPEGMAAGLPVCDSRNRCVVHELEGGRGGHGFWY